MLRVTAIEQIAELRYLVTIDRDGLERTYVFGRTAVEFGTCSVSPPEAFFIDLDDYFPAVRLDQPRYPTPPALEIPRTLVRKLALGKEISLPVVIDER